MTPTERKGTTSPADSGQRQTEDPGINAKMSRPAQRSRKASDPEETGCLRLLEVLAQSDPVPDTASLCLERDELLTLLAEISKGQQSEFLLQITHLAQRRGVPPQEIAARAGFLLACLDMPGDDDAYKILGVPPSATPQEIRDAWIGRVSIYHPDRHPEKTDWFTHQVARLNEAYQTLKDPVRREGYDARRRREDLERQRGGSIAPRHAPPGQPRITVFSHGLPRRRLPTIITGASAVAAGLIVVFLFLSRASNRPEATPFPPPNTSTPAAEGGSRGEPDSDEQRSAQSPRPLPESPTTKQSLPRERRSLFVRRDVQKVSEPSRPRAILAQALPPFAPEPKGLDRQEIDALLDEYVDAYEKGDVERFMATFSPKVREKGALDYQAIRSLYAKGFTGRDQIIYRLKNVDVQIKGDLATVTAQYLISARNASQSQRGVTVTGRIEWKIQREGDKPKIIAINY
jgi:curved DNA-binding protein CbpA